MGTLDTNIESIYPLSPMQQGMLFHTLLSPKSGVYINQRLCRLTGGLQVEALHRAWQEMVERHEPLRTLFRWKGREKPLQIVRRQVSLPWQEFDWRGLSADEQKVKLEELLQADSEKGFDLGQAPLVRLTLIRMEENRYELLWSQHHLLMDGWSGYLVLKEVSAVYEAVAQGLECGLEPPRHYRAYINWLQGQDLPKAEAFWRAALKGFTAPTPLLGTRADERRADQDYEIAEQLGTLPSSLLTALRSFGRRHDLTLSTLAHAAWALLLSRYSGEDDIIFGSVVSGRPAELAGVESTVGMFINTLPVRARLPPQDAVRAWLKDFQNQLVELRQYEYSPLVEVQGWSEVRRDQPLFESFVDYVNYPVDASVWEQRGALKISNIRGIERTNYPLAVVVIPRNELVIKVQYDVRRFDAAAIIRMLGHLNTLLEGIVSNPDQRISELPLLTQPERQQLLVAWNRTEVAYSTDKCLHELIEEQVERTPEVTALVFENRQLTYRELNERANQLAHHLRKLGVGPDTLVGICVERSLEMVIGLLGILKAGGAYVPLDPHYPQERLAFVVTDSAAPVLLTQKHLVDRLPRHQARIVQLDADWPDITREGDLNVSSGATAQQRAYVIYTSGSTGKPKGVEIPHRAVVNFLQSMRREPGLSAEDTLLAITTLSFDIAGLELWLPLTTGSRIVIVGREAALDGQALAGLLERWGATVMQATPSTWRLLLAAGWRGSPRLKILCGGEPWPKELAQQLLARCESLWNMYGPTETTIWSAACKVSGEEDVLIGTPIANTKFYVVDQHSQAVPVGVPGELWIGGEGVARGYLNRPNLTTEKFLPDPFDANAEARVYRTGDLVRFCPGGKIEFIGRLDHQVKIRGFRIELGEIESVLAGHVGVREAVAVAREDLPGDKRLVAYLTAKDGRPPEGSELRDLLRTKLPEYMVPSAFVMLDRLPKTPNGKIDRKALPAPESGRLESDAQYVAPNSQIERILADAWAKALGQKKIGTHDNFFDLGGHSLLLIRIQAMVREALKTEISIAEMFHYPTVGSLARHLSQPSTASGRLSGDLPAARASEAPQPAQFLPPSTPTEIALANIWCRIFGLKRVGATENFFDLGGDWLLAVVLIREINKTLQLNLRITELFRNPTLERLAKSISKQSQAKLGPVIFPVRAGGSGVRIFFIADGYGYWESRLAWLLSNRHSPFMIDVPLSPKLIYASVKDPSGPFLTVEEMAAAQVALIRSLRFSGPCVLAGYCFRGIVAIEVAHQLHRAGIKVETVFLLDTWMEKPRRWWKWKLWFRGFKLRFRRHAKGVLDQGLGYLWRKARSKLSRIKIESIPSPKKAPLLSTSVRNFHEFDDTNYVMPWSIAQRAISRAFKAYQRRPLASRGVLFRPLTGDKKFDEFDNSYGAEKLFNKGIQIIDVPGGHHGMFDQPNLQILAQRFEECLDKLERDPLVNVRAEIKKDVN